MEISRYCWIYPHEMVDEEESSAEKQYLEKQLHGGNCQTLSDEEVRRAMQLLFGISEVPDIKRGQELLQQWVNLHQAQYTDAGRSLFDINDELMILFAHAMKYENNSMTAYRDALFKKFRHRMVSHPLVGYYAPWGAGLNVKNPARQPHQQSAQAVEPVITRSASVSPRIAAVTLQPADVYAAPQSATSGSPMPIDFTAGMNRCAGALANFLASSPRPDDKPEEDEEDDEDDDLLTQPITQASGTLLPATAPLRFARFAVAPRAVAAAAALPPELTWTGANDAIWVTDNTAANSAWQNEALFTPGANVMFNDVVTSASLRDVTIRGTVAPGLITVNADASPGLAGGTLTDSFWFIRGEPVHAQMKYGYALTGDSSAHITDYQPAGGELQRTGIIKSGESLLVLNTQNSFSGGIDVQNGALYLGCDSAAGSGPITLNADATWTHLLNGKEEDTFTSISRKGSELMVNYNTDASFYTANIKNSLIIDGTTADRAAHVSYGYATYGATQLPSAVRRNVELSGGVFGSGDLYLHGYTYAEDTDRNYVSTFSINKGNLNEELLPDSSPDAFDGTVYLRNTFNSSEATDRTWYADRLLGGAVQLVLQDDALAHAVINMTREKNDGKTVGWYGNSEAAGYSDSAAAQTSDNILYLQQSAEVKGLDAEFLGTMWKHGVTTKRFLFFIQYETTSTVYVENCAQKDERWRVRVVTSGDNTLTLNDTDANAVHRFDGAVGFEQSYVAASQSYIKEYDGETTDASFSAGGGTLGLAMLNLVKYGAATQYIHSAKLNHLTHLQGTLGFNNLELLGNLSIMGGATLELGVTESTNWDDISGVTSDSLQIGADNQLLVLSMAGGENPVSAVVSGSVNMDAASGLDFYVMRSEPGTEAAHALLNVTGTLAMQSETGISVGFSNVEFAKNAAGKTYYLAAAENGITIDGGAATLFQKQFISLGYGYYGIVDTIDSSGSDYLVMTVSGDPRRTWSGMVDLNGNNCVWTAQAEDELDYRWKENHNFLNGQVVLFGNLNEPESWAPGEWGATSDSTTVVSADKHPGTEVNVVIDGLELSHFQKVEIQNDVAPVSVIINSDYWHDGEEQKDSTNYYFCGSGYIRDVLGSEILLPDFEGSWFTDLRKSGSGTVVIATDNSYSGDSIIEGGCLVMQHRNALGTGNITILEGSILQGDFADDRSTGSWSSSYTGEGMITTTISNPVEVQVVVDPNNPYYNVEIDARLKGAHDKKLVVSSLSGGNDSVVTLYGNSSAADRYTYSVFKVLNPDAFYGTIRMDGNLHGQVNSEAAGGNIQLEIMTMQKAADDGNWLNAKIDLSVANGTQRTVLALDALGSAGAAATQTAQVASLQGGADSSAVRINSSVLNMSADKAITLQIMGLSNASYAGVLGFGDFQKTVDYSGSAADDIGMVKHHYGRYGTLGVLNVEKHGESVQYVNSASLNSIHVDSGRFVVDKALLARDIQIDHGTHLSIGNSADSPYGLAVEQGGILAIDNNRSADAFAQIGAGIPAGVIDVPKEDGQDGETIEQAVAPTSFVCFGNGSTITAAGDWYTQSPAGEVDLTVNGSNESMPYTVDIEVENGAYVTVNTHHYTPDESIDAGNDVFGTYNSSHAIQLLGTMTGRDVHLHFNNELISEAARLAGTAFERADGLGYEGQTGTRMGYAAIRDLHQFTGDISVGNMTVLQVTESNTTATASTAAMDVALDGEASALQFTDDVTQQYINNVSLKNGAHVLLGGTLKDTTGGITEIDETQVELDITNRAASVEASLDNLSVVKSGQSISMGGTTTDRTDAENVRMTTKDTTENYDSVNLHHANLVNSLVELHAACSLELTEAVLIDEKSAIIGSALSGSPVTGVQSIYAATQVTGVGDLCVDPVSATETVYVSTDTTVQLTTAGSGTVYTAENGTKVLHLFANTFRDVNVVADGLTLVLADDLYYAAHSMGMDYAAIQIAGSGRFNLDESSAKRIGDGVNYVLRDAAGRDLSSDWVTSGVVTQALGAQVSTYIIWLRVPEPATSTLTLLALSGMAYRRRRQR